MENFLSDDPREQRDVLVLYFAALCVVVLFGYAGMKGFEQERERGCSDLSCVDQRSPGWVVRCKTKKRLKGTRAKTPLTNLKRTSYCLDWSVYLRPLLLRRSTSPSTRLTKSPPQDMLGLLTFAQGGVSCLDSFPI